MQTTFRICGVIALVFFLSSCDTLDPEPTGPDHATLREGEGTLAGQEVASRPERTPGGEAWDFVYWEDDSADRLDPAQEAQLERAISSIDEDLLAYYPFNGNANDESGRGNHGSVVGASLTTDRFDQPASAYMFDGEGDYILIPHSSSLDVGYLNTSYSVAVWLQGVNQTRSRIIQKWDELIPTPYPFSVRAEPTDVNNALHAGVVTDILALSNIWDGEWHHVVFTIDLVANVQNGYVDGSLIGSQTISFTQAMNNTVPVTIGAAPNVDRDFRGQVDDVVIYGRTLTANEIQRLYRYRR
ncbi:MAG TPA: LamG domain-containing protein [Rhodothermales bacterium]|nr:LamG domain-containing protein [Rhodothermales bacterium]